MTVRGLTSRAKRWSKPAITSLLSATGYYRWRRTRLPADRALVLVYHHVTPGSDPAADAWAPFQRGVGRERFDCQMRFLRSAMTPVSLRQVVAAVRREETLPPRAVAVTFDDGYLDNFTVAYPILKKHRIPATMFVTTDFIGGHETFWWDQVYSFTRDAPAQVLDASRLLSRVGSDGPSRGPYRLATAADRVQVAEHVIEALARLPHAARMESLTHLRSILGVGPHRRTRGPTMMAWAHLREMSRDGITVETHTHTHPILSRSDRHTIEDELITSRRLIQERLGQPVEGIAYPDGRAGAYNPAILDITEALGFRFGCVAVPGRVGPGANPFALGRLPVPNAPLPIFVCDLLRAYALP